VHQHLAEKTSDRLVADVVWEISGRMNYGTVSDVDTQCTFKTNKTISIGERLHFTKFKYRMGFWRYVPWSRYAIFAGAIFFLFSGVGFITDLVSKGSLTDTGLFVNVLYAGLVAVLYVASFTKSIKFLPLAILFQFGVGMFAWNATHSMTPVEFQSRAAFDGYGTLASLIVGYVLLIVFITREGIKNFRYRTEMILAQDLHSNLVPVVDSKNSSFELYGVAKPTEEVGGDLIDFVDTHDGTVCYIADVSGHGVAAGAMMGMFKSAVHVLLDANNPIKSILGETTKTLHHLRKRDMFLTCAFLKFNSNRTVEFSTAGHLPILKLRDNSDVFEEMVIKQIPIGVTDDFVYKTDSVEFDKGDLFVLLTDGITETSNRAKEEFGLQNVKDTILAHRKEALIDIYQNIDERVSQFGKQKDDQTILLIRCR